MGDILAIITESDSAELDDVVIEEPVEILVEVVCRICGEIAMPECVDPLCAECFVKIYRPIPE